MSADGYERITEIVKTRFSTGAYGNATFHMSEATSAWLRDFVPAPTPKPFDLPGQSAMHWLTGIPILIDEELSDGAWELRDRTTGDVLYSYHEEPS